MAVIRMCKELLFSKRVLFLLLGVLFIHLHCFGVSCRDVDMFGDIGWRGVCLLTIIIALDGTELLVFTAPKNTRKTQRQSLFP